MKTCKSCNAELSPALLAIKPFATLCRACKEEADPVLRYRGVSGADGSKKGGAGIAIAKFAGPMPATSLLKAAPQSAEHRKRDTSGAALLRGKRV